MKLATLHDGTRDGRLVVVNRELTRCVAVPEIAGTLQAALDDWTLAWPALAALSDELNASRLPDAIEFRAGTRDGALAACLSVGRRLRVRQPRRAGAARARRNDASRVLDRSADVPGRVGPHARPLRGRQARRRSLGHRLRGRGRCRDRRRADGHDRIGCRTLRATAHARQRREPSQPDSRGACEGFRIPPVEACVVVLAGRRDAR